MTKIQMTAPTPIRLRVRPGCRITKMTAEVMQYFIDHPHQLVDRVRVESHLMDLGFKRAHRAGEVLEKLTYHGYLKPHSFARYELRCAA